MRLVAADPSGFAEIVAAHCSADNALYLAHADGTVTKFSEMLRLAALWLNPGKRISCLTVLDNALIIAFTDRTAKVISLETGLTVASIQLPIAFTGLAVFEHVLVGWSKFHTEICLLYRFNFEIIQTIPADSFVVNVFPVSGGITAVSSSDVHWLRKSESHWKLESIFHSAKSNIVGACVLNKGWFLFTPDSWKLLVMDGANGSLREEMEVNSPINAVFSSVTSTANAAVVQCTQNKYVFVQNNNIQILEEPEVQKSSLADGSNRPFLVSNACQLATPSGQLFQIVDIGRGEIQWQEVKHSIMLAKEKYLVGQTDPAVTAVFEESSTHYTGTQDGKINGISVFTKPVVYIDERKACSEDSQVELPLSKINALKPTASPVMDSRITTQIKTFQWNESKWIGISSNNHSTISICETNYKVVPAHIAVLLVIENIKPFEHVLELMDKSPGSISRLEDLAIVSRENDDVTFLKTATQFLSVIWDSRRVEQLIKAGGPRSLKVLAATSQFLDVDEKQVLRIVQKLSVARDDVASCDAVLWVFEHEYEGIKNQTLPFRSLEPVSDATVARFARNIVSHKGGAEKILTDLAAVLSSENGQPPSAASSTNSLPRQEAMAIKLLMATLELPFPLAIPQTESQLVRIVEIIIPAVHKRVTGAKAILVKLLASHHIQFHQGKQRLLVLTLQSSKQIAIVFDMERGRADNRALLQRPDGMSNVSVDKMILAFSGDGKTVNGILDREKYLWHLPSGFQSLFSHHGGPIVPQKV